MNKQKIKTYKKYNKNRNNNSISQYIVSPGITVTNPIDYIPLFEKPSDTKMYAMPGDTPFSKGAIVNKKVNLYNAKELNSETSMVKSIPMYNTPFNIKGVYFEVDNTTGKYELNEAARLANENAQIVKQTLLAKQQYDLNFLTEWSTKDPDVESIFIQGLASNYVGVVAAQLFTRIYRAAAYIGEAINYDKELANIYMDMQAALQKRSFTAAIGTYIAAFKSIIVDHSVIDEFTNLSHIEKNSKGYNTPFIWHDYSLSSKVLDGLVITKKVGTATQVVNLFNRKTWELYWDNFFNINHFDLLLNGKTVNIKNYKNEDVTIINVNQYVDTMKQYVESITSTLRAFSSIMTTYYAALTIIADTGVIIDSFKPNYDLMQLISKVATVRRDFQLASLINLVSIYKTLNPIVDANNNTINMLIPYYQDFKPFPGTDGNEVLKYINTQEGYRPTTDLSETKIGWQTTIPSLDIWAKTPIPTEKLAFYSTDDSKGRLLVPIRTVNNLITVGEQINVANKAYVTTVKSLAQYFANYGMYGMKFGDNLATFSLYVDGFINMSYLSIAPYMLNSASHAAGIKNANRLF